ncbi:MAG: hypothetical protein HQ595_01120, partial [Candidatus Omnitrophica bacterium]|nr:hypothetical protein [Candidatus Omnitrophota bacterium]
LQIEKPSGEILDSPFNLIGDVQNLTRPSLNIYGDLELNLAGLKKLNPKYIESLGKYSMRGVCPTKIYISGEMKNPEVGLKMEARQIEIAEAKIDSLSIVSKLENNKLTIDKCYLILYGGEINLEGSCDLDSAQLPADLNINIFNLELNNLIADISGKPTPVHGRFFSLGKLKAPLKDHEQVEGKLWVSAAGSNILQLPLFEGLAEIIHLPELRNSEFKEASGNFAIARRAIRTEDFKIISNSVVIHFKGYMDFTGDLGFDVQPSFSERFLQTTPRFSNILGIFFDSTGNFLGEIKMKGNLKKPRLSYKPVSADKLFPRALEEGLKALFKRKQED